EGQGPGAQRLAVHRVLPGDGRQPTPRALAAPGEGRGEGPEEAEDPDQTPADAAESLSHTGRLLVVGSAADERDDHGRRSAGSRRTPGRPGPATRRTRLPRPPRWTWPGRSGPGCCPG